MPKSAVNQSARRADILQAALLVFDRHGFSATTMDQIAGQAGISKGSIYNYFSSKERLFAQLFADFVQTAEAGGLELLSKPVSASQRLERVLEYWFQQLDMIKRFGRLVLEFWATAARQPMGAFNEQYRVLYNRRINILGQVLSEGVRRGEFRADFELPVAASMILGILDGVTLQSILGVGATIDAGFLDSLKRAVLTSLKLSVDLPADREAT